MTRSDWKLVQALRRSPEGRLGDLARDVGTSPRTVSRRYDSMLEDRAMVFDPMLDYARFPQTLATLVIDLVSPARPELIERAIREWCPLAIRSWGAVPAEPLEGAATIQLLVSARTAVEIDDLTARVAHLPGVQRVLPWHSRVILPVREWLDERIENLIRAGSTGR